MTNKQITKSLIIQYMKDNIRDHIVTEWLNDDGTRNENGRVEVNLTSLALNAANALDLTDIEHILWDYSFEVAEWYGDDDCQ